MTSLHPIRSSAAVAALAVLLTTPFAATAADGPTAVVRATVDEVIAILKSEELTSADKRGQIVGVVEKYFDFRTLSRLVLARNWRALSKDEQEDFVEQFKQHLALTYGKNVEAYSDETVELTGEREEARGDRTVLSRIKRPQGEDVVVHYRLRQTDGVWRMIDVKVEGVSLVANYRAQFQDILSKQGATKLLAMLRDKNAKGQVIE